MNRLRPLEMLALAGVVAQPIVTAFLVPDSPLAHLEQPVYLATISGMVIALAMVALRFRGTRAIELEKALLVMFLAGMPIVYAWTALRDGQSVSIEAIGIPIYGGLAIAGWFVSPWFLAIGIAGHGVAWDLWHHGGLVVPPWYAIGCLSVDVALGVYVATQIDVYRRMPAVVATSRAVG